MLEEATGATPLDVSLGVAYRRWQMTTDSRCPLVLAGGGREEEEEGIGSGGASTGR